MIHSEPCTSTRYHNTCVVVVVVAAMENVDVWYTITWKTQHHHTYCAASPTIHVQPGQTLKLTLKNQLEEPLGNSIYNSFRKPNNTNIHLHGLHISGEGMSDK